MSAFNTPTPIPHDYVQIKGSERRPSASAQWLGPADPTERFSVTIVLRRRPDGAALPDFDHFLRTPPHARPKLSPDDFARKYGASPQDVDKVAHFARQAGLKVEHAHAGRRHVVVSGTTDEMAKAFAVTFGHYEHTVVRRRYEKPRRESYRGRDGFVHVPKALEDIVQGVFGLDNRRITKSAGGDPSDTTTLTVPQVRQLYDFPANSAAGQTIAILSEAGYKQSDITNYFATLPAGFPAPTITDLTIDASNDGTEDLETTQDICIAATAAPNAAIAVFFTSYTQQGWVDALGRLAQPNAGDPACSVMSTSFYVSNGDDPTSGEVSAAWVTAVDQQLLDLAIQGITFCVCTGDQGSDCTIGDGKSHVTFPASDPWALAVGGTTIGNVNGASFDEWVWNDTFDITGFNPSGATGGGISDYFGQPSYQAGKGVPASLNDGHVGRGIPDVSANASPNSGYPLTLGNATAQGLQNPVPMDGTSASTPLWAGLIAVMNASLGVNIGFVNPALYEIGSAGFRDILGAPGPTDNGFNGAPGYPAGPGWDACTGWGSPNGGALLGLLSALYSRSLYFIVDKSTYGADEVADAISVGGGLYPSAFWLVLEGFSIHQLGSVVPTLGGAFHALAGVTVFADPSGAAYERPDDLYTPQRIRFPFDIVFSATALSPVSQFPAAGTGPALDLLTATIAIGGTSLAAEAVFELVSGADPYFANIDPTHDNVFYLSQDLRVFSAANGDVPLPGGPTMANSDPYAFIQNLLGHLNGSAAFTTPGPDPLNALPGQSGYETGDSSVTPVNAADNQNFNFAIARVRLQDAALATAPDVRVFFRLFVAQSFDTDFQPATTYKSTLGSTGADAGHPVFPLPSGTGLMDPSGQSNQTIPFFASDANGTHDYDATLPNANIRNIQIPMGTDKVWAYYGCFLDVYNASNQSKFGGTHHCIVAEIAYDDAPIVNSNGLTASPENTDKLAQRNLQITASGNPSYPLTHRVPQAFDMRPSAAFAHNTGQLLAYPDELMVDWRATPKGSVASLYWPQIDAAQIIALATELYGVHPLVASDAHTIQCPVGEGVTWIPVPTATGQNFAGLFTVELPASIRAGQEYKIQVRRVASRRATSGKPTNGPPTTGVAAPGESSIGERQVMRNWRYVTGTFQVTIPVGRDEALLRPEETTLAVLKWRLEHMSPVDRWYPVMQRFVAVVSGRVNGFGGNATAIQPSLGGVKPKPTRPCDEGVAHEGKVVEVIYDCFGAVTGFVLEACCGEPRLFECSEPALGELVLRACRQRMRVTVFTRPPRERIHQIRIGR